MSDLRVKSEKNLFALPQFYAAGGRRKSGNEPVAALLGALPAAPIKIQTINFKLVNALIPPPDPVEVCSSVILFAP